MMLARACSMLLLLLLLALQGLAAEPLPAGATRVFGTDRFLQYAQPVAFSADDKSIVGFSASEIICTWDADDGRLLKRQRVPGSGAPNKSISADGKLAAFLGNPREHYVVCDVAAGKEMRRLIIDPPWSFHDAVFVNAGKHLVTAENNSRDRNKGLVKIWSIADGSCRIVAEEPFYFQRLVASPDGKRFAASTNWGPSKKTRCWDAETGKALFTAESASALVTFAQDGKTLIGAPFQFEREWRAWDTGTGKRAAVHLPPIQVDSADSINLRAIGSTLFVGTMQGVIVWDLLKGKEIRRLDSAWSLGAVDHSGKTLLTLQPRWQRWDIATGKPMYPDTRTFGNHSIDRICISPDSRFIATVGGYGQLCICDAKTGDVTNVGSPDHLAFLYGLAFTPDGKRLVCAYWAGSVGGFVVVRETPSGKAVNRFPIVALPTAVAVSSDGKKIVLACWQNLSGANKKSQWHFVTHEIATGKEVARCGGHDRDYPTDLSRDGRRAITLGVLVDIAQGERRHDLVPEKEFFWLSGPSAISPDGRYYAIHALKQAPAPPSEYRVVVLEVASGRPVAVLKTAAMGKIAFAADHRRIVTADWDGVRVWDLASEQCLLHHKAHDVWDFYGQSLIDLPNYREKLHQSNGTFAKSLDVSPDGTFAATGHPDTRIFLWDLTAARKPDATPAPGESAWDDLLDSDAAKAYSAMRRSIDHPAKALSLLKEKLRPAVPPEREHVSRLIEQLDDTVFKTRECAQKQLFEFGPVILPHLREAVKTQISAERRRRLDTLIAEFKNPTPLKSEELRSVRAVEVLERIGTVEARRLLEPIAKGSNLAARTHAARAALERLGEEQ